MAYRILIVDDSPVMRAFIKRIARLSGLDAADYLEASDGNEALKLLRDEWVDAILTDINMPGMNGEQLVRCLGEDELLKSVPVVVVSTDSTEARVTQMLAMGASGYVKKPFLPETLREELQRVLGVEYA